MARLFFSTREADFIQDTVKEYVKDLVGQKIHYYAVSTMDTRVHPIYNEAPVKIFEKPVVLDVLAGQPEWSTKHNLFGMEQTYNIELFIQVKDLLDKGITPSEGDFFTYGDGTFEVVSLLNTTNIFGLEEYNTAFKVIGKYARPGVFDPNVLNQPATDDGLGYEQNSGIQKKFVQQRGLVENEDGITADIRHLRDKRKEDMAEIALGEGPRKVDKDITNTDSPTGNKFYDE